MKNLFRTQVYSLAKLAIIITCLATNTSCSTEEGCSSDNTGIVIIENTNAQYSLHFYKSNSNTSGNGDLIIEPQSKASINLPAGSYSAHLKLNKSTCNPNTGRCFRSWEVVDDNKQLDLSSCEDLNLIY